MQNYLLFFFFKLYPNAFTIRFFDEQPLQISRRTTQNKDIPAENGSSMIEQSDILSGTTPDIYSPLHLHSHLHSDLSAVREENEEKTTDSSETSSNVRNKNRVQVGKLGKILLFLEELFLDLYLIIIHIALLS